MKWGSPTTEKLETTTSLVLVAAFFAYVVYHVVRAAGAARGWW